MGAMARSLFAVRCHAQNFLARHLTGAIRTLDGNWGPSVPYPKHVGPPPEGVEEIAFKVLGMYNIIIDPIRNQAHADQMLHRVLGWHKGALANAKGRGNFTTGPQGTVNRVT